MGVIFSWRYLSKYVIIQTQKSAYSKVHKEHS